MSTGDYNIDLIRREQYEEIDRIDFPQEDLQLQQYDFTQCNKHADELNF